MNDKFEIVWNEYNEEYHITDGFLPLDCTTEIGRVSLKEGDSEIILKVRDTNMYLRDENFPFKYKQLEVKKL